MYYSKFTIRNYKGIKELKLDVNDPPQTKVFTLVGLNESGKTTILEAIHDFSHEQKKDFQHTLIPKDRGASFTGSSTIEAVINFDENDKQKVKKYVEQAIGRGVYQVSVPESMTYTRSYNFERSSPTDVTGTFGLHIYFQKTKKGKSTLLPLEQRQAVLKKVQAELLPEIIYYPDFLSRFPDKIFLEKEKFTSSNTEEQYYSIVQDILSSIDPSYTIEQNILEKLGDKNNQAHKEALEKMLALMGGKISQVVFLAWGKFSKVGKKEIRVTTDSTPEGRHYLEIKLKEGTDTFHIAERSLGFRWFFTFLMFTEFRKNRITSSGEILFLLDEPASNLHSSAQKNLLSTLADIATKSKLVYTTHSHHLINPEWLEGAYIVRNKALDENTELDFAAAQTDVEAVPYRRFVSENPTKVAYFQPILDVLEFQPGLLEAVPSVVLLEGKNDYYGLKYISRVIFQKSDLNFYPGTSSSKLGTPIALYLAWGRKFIVLLDADAEGERQKEAYIKEFGMDVKDKIFTLDDVAPTYNRKEFEKLFTDQEKIDICKVLNPNVSKFKKHDFNIGIQMLLAQNKSITLSNETRATFKEILDFLQSKLV